VRELIQPRLLSAPIECVSPVVDQRTHV
jgi:hypothetical protein